MNCSWASLRNCGLSTFPYIGIRPYRDLPFPGLIDEPVADLKLHRQHAGGGRLLRLALLRGSSGHGC